MSASISAGLAGFTAADLATLRESASILRRLDAVGSGAGLYGPSVFLDVADFIEFGASKIEPFCAGAADHG